MMAIPRAALGCAALALCACAAPPPAAGAGPVRVVVRLTQPIAEPAAIAAAAGESSGRPVRYLAATSELWHALSLDCDSADDCASAVERLRADTRRFAAVEIDGRKRIVTPQY